MPDNLLQTMADDAFRRHPEKTAVLDGLRRLSYQELYQKSNRLARCLLDYGLMKGQHVVLAMSRSVQMIVAMLGVLKAGGVYIPVSADTPAQRRNKILANSQPLALICDETSVRKIVMDRQSFEFPACLICLGSEQPNGLIDPGSMIIQKEVDKHISSSLSYETRPDEPACIHYTSGSTGEPKGVVITHRNISEYADWIVNCIVIGEEDKILCTAPFHFDMSLFDVYGNLRTGATLCIADEQKLLFPRLLVEFADSEKVTIWKGVSSLLVYLARMEAISRDRLSTLRKILFSGEVLPTKYLIQWMDTYPDKEFFNAYGPTEATGISMYYRVINAPRSPDERIPIGIPCENTEILLLNDNKRPVAIGEPGEIYIKGVCVAQGYLNDSGRTAEVFLADPLNRSSNEKVYRTGDYARQREDGNYEFLGRKDNQVKYMGYRIELTDIEQSLVSIPGVKDAGVIMVEYESGGLKELVAYIEIGREVSILEIIEESKGRLPSYMVPKHFYPTARIPRSDGGKIDRAALTALHQERGQRSC